MKSLLHWECPDNKLHKKIINKLFLYGTYSKFKRIFMFSRMELRFLMLIFCSLALSGCFGSDKRSTKKIAEDQTPSTVPDNAAPEAVTDVTKPVILLNGNSSITLEAGSSYVEQGATVTDDIDSSVLVITTGEVDSLSLGTNIVTYSATDAAGNTALVTRKVIVSDTVAPLLALSGETAIELLKGEAFLEPGFTAVDSFEGPIVVEVVGDVNNTAVGSYILTYKGSDSSGNESSAIRTINVLPSTTLNIQSKDYFSGNVIEGAAITVSASVNGNQITREGISNESGELLIILSADAQRITVNGDANAYGEHSEVLRTVDQVVDLFLQPVNAEITFTPSVESNLEVSGLSIVTLPANSLVDGNGNAATSNVIAEITIIDPGFDPDLMPGNFETIDPNTGDVAHIESFGAVNVTFSDENANRYNLAEGQVAMVRIPLASGANSPPNTIPLYYFDDVTGFWVEEGTATLMNVAGKKYYEGRVSHFSTWNADYLYESVQIKGCVQDGEGNAVHFAAIQAQGVSYSGQAITSSDITGNFSVTAKPSSEVLLSARSSSGLSRTSEIFTGTEDLQQTDCIVLEESSAVITLTWGKNPSDLDTQFFGPSNEAGDANFLVYYSNKEHSVNGSSIWLDVDDTNSFGPEITTVSSFPYTGRYSYAVKHFSGLGNITTSPTRVELDFAGQRYIFSPPEGDASKCWAVFDFIVDDAGVAIVEEAARWETPSYCMARGEANAGDETLEFSSGNILSLKSSSGILKSMINSKYYAK